MLPSLRPLIAEGMEARAVSVTGLLAGPDVCDALTRGAATLRWCDERDPDNTADLDEANSIIEEIAGIVGGAQGKVAAQIREVLGI